MLQLEDVVYDEDGFRLEAGFDCAARDRIAVIGPSGAGKSTLLDLIAGFAAPSRGRILWNDADITAMPPDRRPVGMLFQEHNLFPHLTVARNLALAVRPDGRNPDAAQAARIEQALARVGLAGMGGRRPGQLSGGQQSRASLARVLLQGRPIMLLDEPFGALGPALRAEMLALVDEVAGSLGALVLMVSHDPQDALALAGRTVLVAEGRAHPPAETRALFADPPDALRRYLGRTEKGPAGSAGP